MARINNIEVEVALNADTGRARQDIARDLGRIEKDAKDTAADIERAFDRVELSPELDTADIRHAIDLAQKLDEMVVNLTIDTPLEDIKQAESIARSLRAFQGRVDLSVEGREELKDAADLAEDLDQTRKVRIDVDESDLQGLDNRITEAGQDGADGISDAIGGIDFENLGGQALDQFAGALKAAGPLGAAAAGLGVAFGDDFIGGLTRGFTSRRTAVVRSITSGLSESDMAIAGQAAGGAYAAGFGQSLPQVQADTDRLVATLGDIVDEADFGQLAKQGQVLSEVLGIEVPEAAQRARRAVAQGLADDVQDAFDDMIGGAGEFGETGLEALDVLEEFGANFARFEVDGGRAIRFVASSFEDGLIPTIDRAGESFEEFTTRVVDGDAADALAEIGLNFEEIQAAVARGGPEANAAMRAVIESILEYGTEADRARLSNVIFGQSFEQVSDHGELLRRMMQLLGDDTDAYAGKAEEATAALEGTSTAWQAIGRDVEQLGVDLAKAAEFFQIDFSENWDPFGAADLRDNALRWLGIIDDVGEETDELTAATDLAARSTGSFGVEADLAAVSVGAVGDEVSDLRLDLDQLADFEADQLMRQIASAGDDLAASFENGAASAVGLNGVIDISTQEGRRLQAQLEGMSGALIDSQVQFANGEISANEMQAAQALLRAEFDRATGAAGLTTAQIEALRLKYLAVLGLDPIKITIDYDGSFAENELNRFNRIIDETPRNITVTTTTRTRTTSSSRSSTSRSSGGSVNFRARGGPTSGLTVVGEEGPELVDFGSDRAYVYNNAETRRMARSGSTPSGRAAIHIENVNVVERPIWRELDELEAIYAATS